MYNVILVGNPNTGKTTLFNTLTRSNEKASNWHGVTVDTKSKSYKFKDNVFNVTDLPGLYSLSAYSNEEKVARDYLLKNKDDVIINICDANNLERNLKLTLELLREGLKVILAVNMANEVKGLDYKKLSSVLGIPVFDIDARKKSSVLKIKNYISDIYLNKKLQNIYKLIKNKQYTNDLYENIKNISDNFKNKSYNTTDKIDKIVLNKWLFVPVFFIVTFLIFYLTFGHVGNLILDIYSLFLNKIFDILRNIILCINMSNIVKEFLIGGVLNSIQTVLGFVPQIVMLMFFVNFLEDTGFMSRVAFMFDGFLKKIGLTGKSLFSLMMGFGCTTSAILTTRNLENKNLRKRTIFLLPFMNCSAKLPVFLVVSSLFFNNYKYLFVFGLYIFSIVISIIIALIYKKFIPENNDVFILEMPKYRLPLMSKTLKDSCVVIKEFLVKVGTTISFFSAIVWILQNFSISFEYLHGANFEKSILYFVSEKFVSIFKFIGINNAGMVAALIFGVIAKEMIIVGLAMINGVVGSVEMLSLSLVNPLSVCSFTLVSSIVFLVFILIYSPCISAISMIKNELGRKSALYVFVFQFVLAFLISFIVYKSLTNINFLFIMIAVFVLAKILMVVLKLRKKKHCWGNCNACRKV